MPTAMIGPKFYAFDDNGNPLSGGKVFTYQAGTNKPKATFTGEDGSVQNTNPVILNAAGYASIHLAGAYKIVLKDANDVIVWTADPVTDAAQRQSDFINEQDASYLGPKKIRINGDLTGFYELGRAVRIATNTGFQYGFVRAATFGAGFTIIDLNGPVSLTPGVISAAGGLVTSALFGGFSAEDVATFGFLRQELKSDNGAEMIGTTGGKTVQKRFDTLAEDYLTNDRAEEVLQEHNDDANAHPGLTGFLIQLTNKAQAAVDAALIGTSLFDDITSGLNGTSPGDYFFVPSGETSESLILYKNISDQGTGVPRSVNFVGQEAVKTLAANSFNNKYAVNFSCTVADQAPGEPGFLDITLEAKKEGGTFTEIASKTFNSFGSGSQFYPGQQLEGEFPLAGANAVFRFVFSGDGGATATTLTYTEGDPVDAVELIKTFPTLDAMLAFIAEAEAEADRAKDEADRAEAAANAAEETSQDYEVHATQAQATIDQQVLLVQNAAIFGTTEITTNVNAANAEIQTQLDGLINSGWFPVTGSFALGGTITERNQILFNDSDSSFYSWSGELPKIVSESSTPASSGGIGLTGWVNRADSALRSALASPDSTVPVGGVQAGDIVNRLAKSISPKENGAVNNGVADDTIALKTTLTSAILNGDKVLLSGNYLISGPLSNIVNIPYGELIIECIGNVNITVSPSATPFSDVIYFHTDNFNNAAITGGSLTINGNNKASSGITIRHDDVSGGQVKIDAKLVITNLLENNAAETRENQGLLIFGEYTSIEVTKPFVKDVSRTNVAGGATKGVSVSGISGVCIIDEPYTENILCPDGGADADGVAVFGKQSAGANSTRLGRAVINKPTFVNCKGRSFKGQVSDVTVSNPKIRRTGDVVTISQGADFDFQFAGNVLLHEPTYEYLEVGGVSPFPVGSSFSSVVFQQVLDDRPMIGRSVGGTMYTQVAVPRYALVVPGAGAKESFAEVAGLTVLPVGSFAGSVFERAILETDMGVVASKSEKTSLSVSNVTAPMSNVRAIGYTGFITGDLSTKLSWSVTNNASSLRSTINRPFSNLAGNAVGEVLSFKIFNNDEFRDLLDPANQSFSFNSLTVGSRFSVDLSTLGAVTNAPAWGASGYAQIEVMQQWFGFTDLCVKVFVGNADATNTVFYTQNGGATWGVIK